MVGPAPVVYGWERPASICAEESQASPSLTRAGDVRNEDLDPSGQRFHEIQLLSRGARA